jgi:hypothetical protein
MKINENKSFKNLKISSKITKKMKAFFLFFSPKQQKKEKIIKII